MKKKISILFMLSLIMGLSACGNKGGADKKGDVINDSFLKMNVNDYSQRYASSFEFEQNALDFADFASATQSNGMLILTDTAGQKAVYNPLSKQFIFSKDVYAAINTKSVVLEESGNLVLIEADKEVDGEHTYKLVDHHGFVLYEGKRKMSSVQTEVIDDGESFEQSVTIDFVSGGYLAAIYNFRTGEFIKAALDSDPRYPVEEGQYLPPELLENKMVLDLKTYGHPGYRLVLNQTNPTDPISFSVFDKKNKLVSNAISTDGATVATTTMIGDNIYYQSKKEINEKDKEYTYSTSETVAGKIVFHKYLLTTYCVNYMKGSIDEVKKFNYVIGNDSYALLNKKGVAKYSQVKLTKINDNRLLEDKERSFILDESLGIHDDVTNINFYNLYRVGSNYFDFNTKILYNNKLLELCKFGSYQDYNNFANGGFFILKSPFNSNLYALADANGKLLTDYIYSHVDDLDIGNKLLVKEAGEEGKQLVIEVVNGKKGQTINTVIEVAEELLAVVGGYGMYEKDAKRYLIDLQTGAVTEYPSTPSGTLEATTNLTIDNALSGYALYNNSGELTLSGNKLAFSYYE